MTSGGSRQAAAQISGVCFTYNRGLQFERPALRDVTFTVPEGAVTAVIGATAAGKSSLLQVIAGLLAPDSGRVEVLGSLSPPAGTVGMVFQRPEIQLFSPTVEEDVGLAARYRGLRGSDLDRRVDRSLEAVGLDPAFFRKRSPHALSLGEKRRVALAGILSLDPRLLVLDEPGASLDPPARAALVCRLSEWVGQAGSDSRKDGERRTVVFTSHDMDEVAVLADEVVVLREGRLEAAGEAAQVMADQELLARAGLRPPIAARVAARLGARPEARVMDSDGLLRWLEARRLGAET